MSERHAHPAPQPPARSVTPLARRGHAATPGAVRIAATEHAGGDRRGRALERVAVGPLRHYGPDLAQRLPRFRKSHSSRAETRSQPPARSAARLARRGHAGRLGAARRLCSPRPSAMRSSDARPGRPWRGTRSPPPARSVARQGHRGRPAVVRIAGTKRARADRRGPGACARRIPCALRITARISPAVRPRLRRSRRFRARKSATVAASRGDS